ncbi:MAG: DUF819 domain-containing protein [Thermoanaerobaculia bacterium]
MIDSPFALLATLATSVALVFWLERRAGLAPIFRRLPAIFWIYFLPMLATSLGLLPATSPLYGALSRYLLPASLVLMLLSTDLRAIVRLGPRALGAIAAAAAGIALGAIVAFLVLGDALGDEAWKGLAALTATWTGGSANLIAVATSLGLSPETQGIAILVDTVVGYSWMGILIALSARQAALDRRLRAERGEVAAMGARIEARLARDRRPLLTGDAVTLIAVALATAALGLWLGTLLPPVGDVLTPFAWGILIVTSAGILLSLTPLARLDGAGASGLGYAGFYLLLASVGAQADLHRIFTQPLWIVAGAIMILVHAAVLLAALRWMRAPSFFLGAASQASIGGYSSAPVVAEIFQAGLAPVGLLLAVLGNILGTYLGLAVAQLLRALGS